MIQIFKSPNFNFIGNKNKAFWFSGTLLAITLVSMVAPIYPNRGFGPNMSIDFTGGTVVQLQFEKSVHNDLGKLRDIAMSIGYGKPEVKSIGKPEDNEVQIIVKLQQGKELSGDELKAAFNRDYPQNPFSVRRVESVGPKVGKELGRTAVLSILVSLLAIIIYVAARFSLPFGVAAVLALAHDVIIPVGLFSVLNIEISLPVIAALLTIAGYSINDTIVIFDRIRENLGDSLSRKSVEDVINASINQTLSRTIITSLTTLVTVLAVGAAFLGSGDVVFDFALALTVGILIGTYSSVFIASPIVVLWNKRWPIKA
jgi:preprotein translocase subunit SecF